MALNTSPSFMSGNTSAANSAGQRATMRRRIPGTGGMSSAKPAGMSPTFHNGGFGFGFNGAAPFSGSMGKSMSSMGYNPSGPSNGGGGGMGGPPPPPSMPPMRTQGDPLMSAEPPPPPMMGDGMVAATAPPMMPSNNIPGMNGMGGGMDELKQRMGGNTGITGGMPRGRNIFQAY